MVKWLHSLFNVVVGSGAPAREVRSVRDFDLVDLSGSGVVAITQTGEESLTVEADDNVLPLVLTEVRGRRLVLGTVPGAHVQSTRPVRFTLTVRDLRGIAVSGSGRVTLSALVTDHFEADISGSGDITISGQAARQELSISGSGSYHADDFATGAAQVDVSGSGRATLRVAEQLVAHISGSGSVRYIGQPQVRKSVSGSGRVRQQQPEASATSYD